MPRLSRRTSWDLATNPIGVRVAAARASGDRLFDLTESNPTRCAIVDGTPYLAALGHPRGTSYEPISIGEVEARAAIARYYADRGVTVPIERIVCSASTSEAYAWLFKLLCDDGDAVLVPRPSYPLFEFLATLEDVNLIPYPLIREEGFRVDEHGLERAIEGAGGRARAILLVHPNNPTGTFVRRDDAETLERACARHDLALVADEVFVDYAHGELPSDRLPTFAGRDRVLGFTLSGLSKVCALPQVKLGWTVMSGPAALVEPALARLEVIADTYLSVSTPVQRALPELLAARGAIQGAIRARVSANLRALDAAIAEAGDDGVVRRLPCDGGWSVIVEVPRTLDEDGWIARLLDEERILVHPGYFFDLDREGYLVVSLLPEEREFQDAIGRLVRALHR
jgi:alanine-synthesizing transaminase